MTTLPHLQELFIDGKWVKPVNGKYIDVINPFTEEVIQKVANADAADVASAVTAAKNAFLTWGQTTGKERATYLLKMADKVEKEAKGWAHLETLDSGKPLRESLWDMEEVAGCFRYYADLAEKLDARQYEKVKLSDDSYDASLRFEPVGVVGAITPWNYPALMALWKIAPALAAGCTIVLKPSELTPLTGLQLARIAQDSDLPPGVLNVVTGTGVDAGAPIVQHPDVDKVAFTGSVPTGSKIMTEAGKTIKNVSLELGGKSAAIVFDSKNIERTIEWLMFGCFFTNGQICSATSRLLLQEDIAEELLSKLVNHTKELIVGNPLEEKSYVGPLVSKLQQQKVLKYIEGALLEGAVIAGQAKAPAQTKGFFVPPTILTQVKTHMKVWNEEIFGPVLSVMTFKAEEDAIQMANDSEFGLAGAVFSSDSEQMARVSKALRVGVVWNNCSQPNLVEVPWGGMKKSGIGRELGTFGLDAYLEPKQICSYVVDKPFGFYPSFQNSKK
jgi:betaine-aldehyde dehydrogenase